MKKVILAIDDSEEFLEALKAMLEGAGYDVQTLSDPKKTEEYIETYHPDLLIIDIFMPGRSGFNILEDFKKNGVYSNIPKIFVTGLDDDIERMMARAEGVAQYIVKPFQPEELISRVGELLTKRHKHLFSFKPKLQKRRGKRKIVIADDNEEIRELVSDILLDAGHEVEAVSDGYGLIAYLENNTPAVIILDLMMPEKDGLSILDTLKHLSPYSRIVIYTGHQEYEDSVYARAADRFITKGGAVEDLIKAVEELLL